MIPEQFRSKSVFDYTNDHIPEDNVMHDLIKNYAKEGDRILDTHLGSGSSAIAAHYGGFDFVGMEIDEDYYNAACKRFEAETAQLDIFGLND